MGNIIDEICIDCNENRAIDFLRCSACQIDHDYLEMLDSELTLDWTE
jgi:hypothetical protein